MDIRTADGRFLRTHIYVASHQHNNYISGTLEQMFATYMSILRNKSHLYSEMTSKVENCPHFCHLNVRTLVRVRTLERTDRRTDSYFARTLLKRFICLKGLLHYTLCCGYCGKKCYKSEKCSFFLLALVLRPFKIISLILSRS